ncbi:MAG: hypothetical protein GY791_06160 [Alphaproteobacteria bacterium]|nr:hypothetical protein [Alphaproteobacteria bacterium]
MDDWAIPIQRPLVSIELELASIRFCFAIGVIAMNDDFALVDKGKSFEDAEVYSAWEKKGDLNRLWSLIDVSCPRLVMNMVSLCVAFDDGRILECKNTNTVPEQVNIWGFEEPEARQEFPDSEFLTNYPNDYLIRMRLSGR